MMNFFRSLIYVPRINQILRTFTKVLGFLVPDKLRINPSGTVRIKITKSTSIKLRTNQTSHITRELYWNNPLEFEYTSIFIEIIKEFKTFWDVGANIGYYSILGCKINPTLEVEAFEPSMGPMIYLSENSKLNDVQNQILVHSTALSDRSGNIEFYQIVNPKFPKILNLSGEHNIGTKKNMLSRKTNVMASPIDDIRKDTPPIDLIKIDVEGAEVQVLKGGLQTLKKDRPIIICEVLFNLNEPELNSIMKGLNYAFFAHVGSGLQKVDSLIRKQDDGVRNVFFVPPEKEDLIKKFIL